MEKRSKSFKDMIFDVNGNMEAVDEAFANQKVPLAAPFQVPVQSKDQKQSIQPRKISDQDKARHERWKTFIKSYRESYLTRLKHGFNNMITMLNELAEERPQEPPRKLDWEE